MKALQAKLPPYLLAALAKRKQKMDKIKLIKNTASLEIGNISFDEFRKLGAVLYWCEGSKERENSDGQRVEFVNSDPLMCKFFIKWAKEVLKVKENMFDLAVYINEVKKPFANTYLDKWSKITNFDKNNIRIYFTKNRISKTRRFERISYAGQLRIRVKKSTDLNRKINGWIDGICIQSGI